MAEGRTPRRERRRQVRETALHLLYQCEVGGLTVDEAGRLVGLVGAGDLGFEADADTTAEAVRLAAAVMAARAELDALIGEAAEHWRVERMAVIDRLVMRLAVGELVTAPATPPRVVIDEAIELARAYSGEAAARFVNGVLDGVFGRLKADGRVID